MKEQRPKGNKEKGLREVNYDDATISRQTYLKKRQVMEENGGKNNTVTNRSKKWTDTVKKFRRKSYHNGQKRDDWERERERREDEEYREDEIRT